MFRVIIPVYSENETIPINTFSGRNSELLNFKTDNGDRSVSSHLM